MTRGYIWRPFLWGFRQYLAFEGWTVFESDAQIFDEITWKTEFPQYGFEPLPPDEVK